MNGGEIGDKGEEGLEDFELYVNALRHAVVHCLDDGWDRGEGDGTQGDEPLEGAEGNRDNFDIFRCTAHEDGAKKVLCMPAICHNEVRCRKSQTRNRSQAYYREKSSSVASDAYPACRGTEMQWAMHSCTPTFLRRTHGINTREGNAPEARLAVTCSGDDLRRERAFSAAYMTGIISDTT